MSTVERTGSGRLSQSSRSRRRFDASTRRVRAGLAYLTVSFLAVGLWATLDSRGFYDGFPGGGRHWVEGDGPYNAHLVSDAGAGFFAVGVVLLLAVVWMERRVVQAALVAGCVHGGLHLLFHLRHPSDAIGDADRLISNGALAFGVAVAVALLVTVSRAPADPAGSP